MGSFGRGQARCNISRGHLTIVTNIDHRCIDEVRSRGMTLARRVGKGFASTLRGLGPRGPLRVILSCIEVQFPARSIQRIIRSVLRLGLSMVVRRSCKFCSCTRRCILNSIFILASPSGRGNALLRLGNGNYQRVRDCLLTRREG